MAWNMLKFVHCFFSIQDVYYMTESNFTIFHVLWLFLQFSS